MKKVKVIKLGGSLLDDATRRANALRVISKAWNDGEPVVLVHGGGKHVDTMLAKLGIPKRTYAGLRITDDATLEVVVSVLGGAVNKMLVAEISALGIPAAGISGCDAGTLLAEPHEAIDGVELGHVGRVTGGSSTLVMSMLSLGILPVISSVAKGPGASLLNVNADSAAAAIAVACGAHTLHFITDVPGVLDATGNVVPSLNSKEAGALLTTGAIAGGMLPKLKAALTALEAGVGRIAIGEEGGTSLVAA